MADHIAIKTEDLASAAETLAKLSDEFKYADKIVDHYSGFLGSGRMADTLHEFATNWDVHKKAILDDLDHLSKIADLAAKAWDGLDKDLAKALMDARDNAEKEG